MENRKFKEFLQQTMVKAGAVVIASAIVLTSGSWSSFFRNDTTYVSVSSLPVFVDNSGVLDEGTEPGAEEINEEGIPGSSAPKVSKDTKTTKTTKKVKLKKKSKKTYTKKSKPVKKTTTSRKVTDAETTTVTTETTTNMTSKFKKGSRINTQITTVTTVTTTMVQQNPQASPTASAGSDPGYEISVTAVPTATASYAVSSQSAQASRTVQEPTSVHELAPRVDRRVSNAYNTLGFTINVNSGVSYAGVFDARSRSITLKKTGDTIYHELGHFLAFIAGNVDTSSAFKQVFEQEKSKYTLFNKGYVLQNSSEYFAESFKNYTLDPASLRASRPQTYEAIEAALNSVTDAQVAKIKTVYRAVWGD